MTALTRIAVAHGDGIGPEIMGAVMKILKAAHARIEPIEIQVGESVYKKGFPSGIEPSVWDTLRETKILLKAPITTPQGGGYKSLNVTIRKTLGLYANVRPCVSYSPYIRSQHPHMDVVIIRENEEDLYTGIEHRQTNDMVQCLKLLTAQGCERIVRYAFEYAKQQHRKKVTCFSKDNIMKLTDGLFHRIFDAVAKEYPQIKADHLIVDIGSARLADTPEILDVIVSLNLYGDIISDIAAQVAGSVGLAGSANIGENYAMFEAVHGSAPMIAGQNIANPSGLLNAALMMLNHIGQGDVAQTIQNAWLKTIESGLHTQDIFDEKISKQLLGTDAFADAVISHLGDVPEFFKPARYQADQGKIHVQCKPIIEPAKTRTLVGVDVFVYSNDKNVESLALALQKAAGKDFTLSSICNRGLSVWPSACTEAMLSDHWHCRFKASANSVSLEQITQLLQRMISHHIEFIKTEQLYDFDGIAGYSAGQGE